MANIRTTPTQWEKAREYFEAGLTYAVITEKKDQQNLIKQKSD